MSGLRPWQRAVSAVAPRLVVAIVWGGGVLMAATGTILFWQGRALLDRGQPHVARIHECRHETLFRKRVGASSSSGYYSCTYAYEVGGALPRSGYFQSQRRLEVGDPVPIRYLPDDPGISAAEESLRHPNVVPAALVALPALFLGYQIWRRRRSRGLKGPAAF
jgi:hypothetical protein